MRDFATSRHLRTSSLPLRITLTGFLVFVGLGYVSNFALLSWKTGMTPAGIASYYRGDEASLQFPKEFHELLENTHFHVFIVPVVLLVLTHVFFMTTWSERAKIRVTCLVYAAALADLAAPWLVRYGAAGFAWWKLCSSALYHGLLFFLVLAPLYQTWLSPIPAPELEAGPEGSPRSPRS